MSGSGKGTVLKAFEDLGFFCIDNLPVPLIQKFVEGIHVSGGDVERAAFVVDIRAGEKLQNVEKLLQELKSLDFRLFVLYLEASDEVLLRRFSETRRPHPLSSEKPLLESIRMERKRLRKIRELADATIDTSEYTAHQVKKRVMTQFRSQPRESRLTVHIVSFGYKHGPPLEADLLFDVRFLPNPYFVSGLRAFSGRHAKVVKYLRSFPETVEFMKRFKDFLDYLISAYIKEGRSYLTIGIGCTGGRHRSVFIAEQIFKNVKHRGLIVRVRHRDEKK